MNKYTKAQLMDLCHELMDVIDCDEDEDEENKFETVNPSELVNMILPKFERYVALISIYLKDSYALKNIIDDEDYKKTHELIDAGSYHVFNESIRNAIREFGYEVVSGLAEDLISTKEQLEMEAKEEEEDGKDS